MDGCNFSPVFSNRLNYPNAFSNSFSYTFISLKGFSSHMSPPMDRVTSRFSPIGKFTGCPLQSIIKVILIFSHLVNTLFFAIYQITLCVQQMKLLPCLLHYVNNILPTMD